MASNTGFVVGPDNYDLAESMVTKDLFNINSVVAWGGYREASVAATSPYQYYQSPVVLNGDWKKVVQGADIGFGIRGDGLIFGWGTNYHGWLNNNNATAAVVYSSPIQITTTNGWTDIELTGYTDLAASLWRPQFAAVNATNNSLYTWGYNSSGQLGLNSTITRSSPTLVGTGYKTVRSMMNGSGFYSIDINNTLWALGQFAGSDAAGQSHTLARSSPMQVDTNVRKIVSNYTYSENVGVPNTWLKTDNTVKFVGSINNLDVSGVYVSTVQRSSPVQFGNKSWLDISVNGLTGAGIATNGTLWLWGRCGDTYNAINYNYFGGIPGSTIIILSSPTQISASTDWKQVLSIGQSSLTAIKTDGTLWGWGYADYLPGMVVASGGYFYWLSSPVMISNPNSNDPMRLSRMDCSDRGVSGYMINDNTSVYDLNTGISNTFSYAYVPGGGGPGPGGGPGGGG